MQTEAQRRAHDKYVKKAYWRPAVYFPREMEAEIRSFCESQDMTVNEMINTAVKAYIKMGVSDENRN